MSGVDAGLRRMPRRSQQIAFALYIYTAEIALKLLALRRGFAKDAWNVFDFLIVFIAYLPSTGALTVLRSLRILRALRIVSTVPKRRIICGADGRQGACCRACRSQWAREGLTFSGAGRFGACSLRKGSGTTGSAWNRLT